MDCQLDIVGDEAKGQPGRVSHQEGTAELSGKRVEISCEGSGGTGWVGANASDRPPVVDLGCHGEGVTAVCIPEDSGGNVGEGGSDQGRLRVFSGGGTRSLEPSLSRREWFRLLQSRGRVDDCGDFCVCGAVHILLSCFGGTG